MEVSDWKHCAYQGGRPPDSLRVRLPNALEPGCPIHIATPPAVHSPSRTSNGRPAVSAVNSAASQRTGFTESLSLPKTMGLGFVGPSTRLQRTASAILAVFLIAIVAALAVTLSSVAPSVRTVAVVVVAPIIALTLLLLYFELRGRIWSYAGAVVLGALGAGLRLVVSTQPQLEVGGGLPLAVTVAYVALGILVVVASLGAYRSVSSARS